MADEVKYCGDMLPFSPIGVACTMNKGHAGAHFNDRFAEGWNPRPVATPDPVPTCLSVLRQNGEATGAGVPCVLAQNHAGDHFNRTMGCCWTTGSQDQAPHEAEATTEMVEDALGLVARFWPRDEVSTLRATLGEAGRLRRQAAISATFAANRDRINAEMRHRQTALLKDAETSRQAHDVTVKDLHSQIGYERQQRAVAEEISAEMLADSRNRERQLHVKVLHLERAFAESLPGRPTPHADNTINDLRAQLRHERAARDTAGRIMQSLLNRLENSPVGEQADTIVKLQEALRVTGKNLDRACRKKDEATKHIRDRDTAVADLEKKLAEQVRENLALHAQKISDQAKIRDLERIKEAHQESIKLLRRRTILYSEYATGLNEKLDTAKAELATAQAVTRAVTIRANLPAPAADTAPPLPPTARFADGPVRANRLPHAAHGSKPVAVKWE